MKKVQNLQKFRHLEILLSIIFGGLFFISAALSKKVTDSSKTFQNTIQNYSALSLLRKTLNNTYEYQSHCLQYLKYV